MGKEIWILIAAIMIVGGGYVLCRYLKQRLADKKKLDKQYEMVRKELKAQVVLLEAESKEAEAVCAKAEELGASDGYMQFMEQIRRMEDLIMEQDIDLRMLEIMNVETVEAKKQADEIQSKMDEAKKKIQDNAKRAEEAVRYFTSEGTLNMELRELARVMDEAKRLAANLKKENQDCVKALNQLSGRMDLLQSLTQNLKQAADGMNYWKSLRFRCNLNLTIQKKQCMKARNGVEWYWLLDNVPLMPEGKAVDLFLGQKTDVLFIPAEEYDEETQREEIGIWVYCKENFTCRETALNEEAAVRDTQYLMLKGHSYCLEFGFGSVLAKIL